MRSLVFTILVLFGCCSPAISQTNKPAAKPSADVMRELRMRALTARPSEFGIQPTKEFPQVYGVLMDWSVDDVTATVVSLSNGNASLYTTSTFGVIGGIEHESVRAAAIRFLSVAQKHRSSGKITKEYPYPKAGKVRFYLIGFDGVRLIEANEAALESGKDKYSELWTEGQRVMTELRLSTQKEGKKR